MLLSGGPEEIHFGVLWDLAEGDSEPLVVIAEVHEGWGRSQKTEKIPFRWKSLGSACHSTVLNKHSTVLDK